MEYQKYLADTLRKLPHVEALDVLFSDAWIGSREMDNIFDDLKPDDLDYDCYASIPLLLKAISAASVELKHFQVMRGTIYEDTKGDTHIKSRSKYGVAYEPLPETGFNTSESPIIRRSFPLDGRWTRSLRYLKTLAIGVPIGGGEPSYKAQKEVFDFAYVVVQNAANHLRKLDLTRNNFDSNKDNDHMLTRLSTIMMPKLSDFTLRAWLILSEEDMDNFITAYCRQLKIIRFEQIDFRDECKWLGLLLKWRRLDWTALKDFQLKGCYFCDDLKNQTYYTEGNYNATDYLKLRAIARNPTCI